MLASMATCKSDNINQMITLSVITINCDHCSWILFFYCSIWIIPIKRFEHAVSSKPQKKLFLSKMAQNIIEEIQI
jgi:hypothetical protein